VVQPHFIATAGGSAKSENAARLGMVTGNFLKRLCTIGWALTGLILLALMADNPDVMRDPDRTWGIATRTILGPIGMGLVGLMLACLLAALMSSADCYMIMTSGLVVRNIYAAYLNPDADEKTYVLAGRITSLFVIVGAALVSLYLMDVFGQFKIALEFCTLFAAPFWIGMYWRRANKWSAWLTIGFSLCVFFIIPILAPVAAPQLRRDPELTITNNIVTTQVNRLATETDKEKRDAQIRIWEETVAEHGRAVEDYRLAHEAAAIPNGGDAKSPGEETFERLELATTRLLTARSERDKQGECPQPVRVGEPFVEEFRTGGKAIFWSDGVKAAGKVEIEELDRKQEANTVTVVQRQSGELEGCGRFNLDYLVYQAMGMDLTEKDNAMLETLRLPPRLITPFLVLILLSFITPRNSKTALDRHYVKMKTPVSPDPETDRQELQASYADPARFDHRKLLRGTDLEIQIPTWADVLGFVACFGVCFAFIALLVWLASIGQGP
jgi:SSS family solute:Na+ symporter